MRKTALTHQSSGKSSMIDAQDSSHTSK